MSHGRTTRLAALVFPLVAAAVAAPTVAPAQEAGLATRPSAHPAPETLRRFAAAVRGAGWVVFGEVDHAAAARAAGQELRPRTVVLFGDPRAGTAPMRERPMLALDLPMRVLVWEDEAGRAFLTRSTGEDIAVRVFARHGVAVPPEARRRTEDFLEGLARQATE